MVCTDAVTYMPTKQLHAHMRVATQAGKYHETSPTDTFLTVVYSVTVTSEPAAMHVLKMKDMTGSSWTPSPPEVSRR